MADGTPTPRLMAAPTYTAGGLQVAQTNRTEALAVSTVSAPTVTADVTAAVLVSVLCSVQCYVLQAATPTAVAPEVGTPGSTPIPANTQVILAKRQNYKLGIVADSDATAYIEVIA